MRRFPVKSLINLNPEKKNIGYNDIPISSITRVVEIDLLEMLDEKDIPKPYPVENGFLM